MTYKKMSDVFDLPLSNTDFFLYSADASEEPIECLYSVDAKAIALCVNNHDALVESLILITDLAEQYADEMPEARVKESDIITAKTLLKAIKGE